MKKKQRSIWLGLLILGAVCAALFVGVGEEPKDVDSPLFAVRTALAAKMDVPDVLIESVEATSTTMSVEPELQCQLSVGGDALLVTVSGYTCISTCGVPCWTSECPTTDHGCTFPIVTCQTCTNTCPSTCANTCDITCSSTCAYTCMGSTCSTCYSTCESTCASCEPPCIEKIGVGEGF